VKNRQKTRTLNDKNNLSKKRNVSFSIYDFAFLPEIRRLLARQRLYEMATPRTLCITLSTHRCVAVLAQYNIQSMDTIITGHLKMRMPDPVKTASNVPVSVALKFRGRFGHKWLNPRIEKHYSVLKRFSDDGSTVLPFLATIDWSRFSTDANGSFRIGPIPDEIRGVRVFIHYDGVREQILDIPLNCIRKKNAVVLDKLTCSLEFTFTLGNDSESLGSNGIDTFLETHRPPGRMR
jgi:hypothetical protein